MSRIYAIVFLGLVGPFHVAAEEIDHVLAHPPFSGSYVCGEHFQGQLPYLGDDLGADCMVAEFVTVDGRTWSRTYRNDGMQNEDWFSWRAILHAPCECEVVDIRINEKVNEPGMLGEPPASLIMLRREDDVMFLLAHIQEPKVEVGARVSYGQPIARIGNNGYGRHPHLHIGAWREQTALQIRWDQRYMSDAIRPEPEQTDTP